MANEEESQCCCMERDMSVVQLRGVNVESSTRFTIKPHLVVCNANHLFIIISIIKFISLKFANFFSPIAKFVSHVRNKGIQL